MSLFLNSAITTFLFKLLIICISSFRIYRIFGMRFCKYGYAEYQSSGISQIKRSNDLCL